MAETRWTHWAGRLVPECDTARAFAAKLKPGALVVCDVRQPRNAAHHRKYWALCERVAAAFGEHVTADGVSDVLKLRTGHVRRIQTRQGIVEVPASISFAAMDQTRFSEFYARCCVVVCEEWLPHMSADELAAEIAEMAS